MEKQLNGYRSACNMNVAFNKIVVVGLGYIGLPTAAILASRGINVVGVDIDASIVDIINNGKAHIVEPDLDIIVHSTVKTGNLYAVTVPEPADAFLITVPTPFKKNYTPDLSNVENAVKSIAPVLRKGNLIILESTSPVGTTEKISRQLAKLRKDLVFPHQDAQNPDILIAYCPERVMPNHILRELIENNRIIGGITPKCSERARALYSLFVRGECITADSRVAEMTKLTENAFRDVNIAFANELSIICDKLQMNVWELIKLANLHPRVNILQPGPGVGGHCIAVDPWFIVSATPNEARLIRTAREVNDSKPQFILEKIKAAAVPFKHTRIACLGLTYKANTDDLRESPAVKIMQQIVLNKSYEVNIVEPNITELPSTLAKSKRCKLVSLEDALSLSDVIVLMVMHKEFKTLDEKKLAGKVFINVANIENAQTNLAPPDSKNQARPVSEYGRMMMNRIYGCLIP